MAQSTGTVEIASPGGLFTGYTPTNAFDEMLATDGTLRAPWPKFVNSFDQLASHGWGPRVEQAKRLLRENGVTYNEYGAPRGVDRPWELDPLPLMFGSAEWKSLADGLVQRVTLLNQILADLYGPQELLKRGILPPKFVFGHPGFVLPCHGVRVPKNIFLHLHACHLARQPDGQWVVLADRSQGPSGAGYSVENRIVASRTLPNDFKNLHVERLASFFITLRQTLASLAPRNTDNPRVVLLSPGQRSSTYFEDAYLARYLGYTLVEGGDLTVRGTSVYLKTLGGLLPVDVILRRIPDDDCDCLELNAASPLGVPGLVQAVRSGDVAVANAIGSGVLEAPALLAFLPRVCRFLLDEDLKLPSIATWWCGDESSRRYVEENLSNLIVRPAFQHRASAPILGWTLSAAGRQQLLADIRHRPGLFVGQPRVVRSTAPVWSNGKLQPWHVGLRTFLVASRDGYQVMPGGLSRVSASPDQLSESTAGGERSKDVWVLSDRPVPVVTLLKTTVSAVELRRSTNDLPSRVVDNLLWLGRHVERAESMVRHLRSIVARMSNEMEPSGLTEVAQLVMALGEESVSEDPVRDDGTDWSLTRLRDATLGFLFEANRPTALFQTLQSLRRTAASVRDRISVDSWRITNQLNLDLLFPWDWQTARLGDVLLLLNQMLTLLSAFSGLCTESMTRGPGWRFLDMGRRIERGLQTLRLVRRTLVDAHPDMPPILEAVLETADSSMTYRYRYMTSLQLAPVLDLLLVDESNPRAVGFQLNALSEHIGQLPRDPGGALHTSEGKIMLAAQSDLRLTDVESLCEVVLPSSRRFSLEQFLERVANHLRHLSDSLTQRYLTHTGPSHQLGTTLATPYIGIASQGPN